MDKKARRHVVACCILFIGLVIGVTIILQPYFQRLSEPEYQAEIQNWINEIGGAGILLILAVQIVQVIIAFIPGEPVEVMAGALYGTVPGLLICLAGCVFASAFIFSLSKRFGKKLLYHLFGEEKVLSWKWLQDGHKSEIVTFILFLIPGTPKDMLTYIVGVTEMSAGKFIGISTFARIPSVLSSTMIGSTIRQGDWKLSLSVFVITGLIGIAGIGFKDKVIDFCRRKINGGHSNKTKCESLDYVEAVHSDKVYPLMYCRMAIQGNLDIEKLKDAVNLSSQYVPEILYTYDFKRAVFVNRDLTVENVLILDRFGLEEDFWWDLSKNAQLQIVFSKEEKQSNIVIAMSHILTDGVGFLQYLYLLASLYNDIPSDKRLHNTRDISLFLKNIRVGSPTEQTKYGMRINAVPLRAFNNGTQSFCLNSTIDSDDLNTIHVKAKKSGATLNHVFITAYARVIARLQNTDKVILSCPADLRRFQPHQDNLTVANMTGIYKRIILEINEQITFSETLSQTCIEMALQKERCRCFESIRLLNFAFHKTPRFILKKAIKKSYHLFPVSYTYIGIIDHEKLYFRDCYIKKCYLTGTYRLSPDFQLSISTFRNVCTLNCTLIGEAGDERIGQSILEQIKKELLEWIQE